MKKRCLCLAGVIALVFVVFAIVLVSNHSSRALKNEEHRIALFAEAYGVMLESLAEANLLPEFEAAVFLDLNLLLELSLEGMDALVNRLDALYPYSVSLTTCGNDWMTILENDNIARVYFSITRQCKGFNKIKVEGFINNNTNPVDMYYTYQNGSWVLVDAEVLYPDWSK